MRIRMLALALAAVTACSSTEPQPSIDGVWDLISYRTDGVDATSITGTAVFDGGFVSFNGTVQFPGEPLETINESSQYVQTGNSLTMTSATDTSNWELTFSGNEVVMQLLGDASASRLTLRRS